MQELVQPCFFSHLFPVFHMNCFQVFLFFICFQSTEQMSIKFDVFLISWSFITLFMGILVLTQQKAPELYSVN